MFFLIKKKLRTLLKRALAFARLTVVPDTGENRFGKRERGGMKRREKRPGYAPFVGIAAAKESRAHFGLLVTFNAIIP